MPAQRLLMLSLLLSLSPGVKAQTDPLVQVLQHRHCPQCHLSDADLVHAQLNDANLRGAQLQRANLSQARLDGADLSNSNLSYTNLRGASLRGADLRGSRLYGTDLRDADLNGAQLDPQALEQTHWSGAQGISQGAQPRQPAQRRGGGGPVRPLACGRTAVWGSDPGQPTGTAELGGAWPEPRGTGKT